MRLLAKLLIGEVILLALFCIPLLILRQTAQEETLQHSRLVENIGQLDLGVRLDNTADEIS